MHRKPHYLVYLLLLLSLAFSSSSVMAQTRAQALSSLQSAEEAIYKGYNLDGALLAAKEAQRFFKAQKFTPGVRQAQLLGVTALLQQDKFQAAWTELQRIKALPPVVDARVTGLFLTNEMWGLWGLAQYPEALVLADSAAVYWEQQGDAEQYSYALLLGSYAIYFDRKSDFSVLEARLLRVEKALQVEPTHLINRHFYQLLAGVQRQQGHIDRAIAYSLSGLTYEQQALQESHDARDSNRVAKIYSQLGKLYMDNGALEQSIGYYKTSLEWYQQLGTYGELLKLCMRLGNLHHRLGNYAKAKFYFSSLKLYWPKLPSSPVWQQRNNTFQHLAKAYYYQYFEYHDSLLVYYDKELPYLKKNELAVDKAYINIGKSAMALKQYARAQTAYEAALDYATQKYGQKGSKPAQLYWTLGQLAAQQEQNSQAIAYFDQAVGALYQGTGLVSNDVIAPDLFYDKALASKIYRARGELYFDQATYKNARQDFDQVVALTHYLRDNYTGMESKFSSAEQLRPIYEKAAFCVWKQQQVAPDTSLVGAIFHYAESSKASLLHEHLIKFRNQYAHGGIGIPDSLLEQEERLLIQIARYQEQERAAKYSQNKGKVRFYFDKIFGLQQQLQALEQQLGQTYPHYKTWDHGRSQTATLAQVQAALALDQVLIEYFVTESHCFIIYVSRDTAILKGEPKHQKGRFEKKVRQLRHVLSHFEQAQEDSTTYFKFVQEARWLYTHYLAHPILEGKKELLLLPDQDLHYIPFEILLYQEPTLVTNAYGKLPYLLHQYSLQYHYSAGLFLRTQQQVNTTSGKVLGFAATYGAQTDYLSLSPALRKERSKEEVQTHNYSPPIPGTMDELAYLQQHFKGDFFSGELANEGQFKQSFSRQDYGVVHLAMHGTINYSQPAYSSLVFTENLDSLEDNLLYVYETQHLNGRQANLVVLSACKTGYGRYAEGEGIISLGRSFMHAGVPSVVMTLWELNDVTSIRLMSEFYALLAAGVAKDEALRQAKLHYLKDNSGLTAHPFFWASPILIGNAVSIPVEQRQKPWMLWALLGGLSVATFFSWRIFGT